MTILWDTNVTLSHARKIHVCGSATCSWDWCSVYTSRRLQGNRHCLQVTHLAIGKNQKISVHPKSMLLPFVSRLPPRRRWACWWIRGTTSSQCVDQHVQVLHCTRRTTDLFVVEFVYWGGFSASVLQLLLAVALWFWWLRRSLHVVSSYRFYLGCCVPVPNCFHVFYACLRCTLMYDLLLFFCRSMRRMLRHIQSRAVTLCKSENFEIVPNMESYPFCLFSLSVSCVINSLSLSVPMTRAVSWTFLYQVLWNR